MTKSETTTQTERFRQALQLLYWSFFKPYSLWARLREIHPELKIDGNPFALWDEFEENPALRRYASQCWWLALLVPLAVTLVVGLVYSLLAPEPFDWIRTGKFFIGWVFGLFLARRGGAGAQWGERLYRVVIGLGFALFLLNALARFFPGSMQWLSSLPSISPLLSYKTIFFPWWPMAFGVAFGVALLLRSPVQALEALRKNLAFASATEASNLARTADQWLAILATARTNLAELAQKSNEIPEVYIAGNSLEPDTAASRFKGRVDLFRELEALSLAAKSPTLLLYGGRRTGKTSALKYLPVRLGPEIVPMLVNVQALATIATNSALVEELCKEMIRSARKSRNLILPRPDSERIREDPFAALLRWLDRVEKTAERPRFLLCLDEYERLDDFIRESGSKAILNFLRGLTQRDRWIVLYAGSHLPDELDDYWSDYLIETRSLRVSYLAPEDARELIVRPVPDFPDIYQPETVDHIIHLTRCQPFLIQLLCLELVKELNLKKQKLARPRDVDGILEKVFETGHHYFRELWKIRLNADHRRFLSVLVRGKLQDEPDPDLIRSLIYQELIEKMPKGGYDFQVPLIKCWVSREIGRA